MTSNTGDLVNVLTSPGLSWTASHSGITDLLPSTPGPGFQSHSTFSTPRRSCSDIVFCIKHAVQLEGWVDMIPLYNFSSYCTSCPQSSESLRAFWKHVSVGVNATMPPMGLTMVQAVSLFVDIPCGLRGWSRWWILHSQKESHYVHLSSGCWHNTGFF